MFFVYLRMGIEDSGNSTGLGRGKGYSGPHVVVARVAQRCAVNF